METNFSDHLGQVSGLSSRGSCFGYYSRGGYSSLGRFSGFSVATGAYYGYGAFSHSRKSV